MAFHTKKQFSDLCGITTKVLSTYASRNKVVYSGEFVDDSIEPNISFLKKRQELKGGLPESKKIEAPPIQKKQVIKPAPDVREPEIYRPPPPDTLGPNNYSGGNESLIALEKEKLMLGNKKLGEEIDILKKRNEKISEESVLVEHVRALIIIQSESAKLAWENATEDVIITLKREFQLTNEQVAKAKSSLNDIINNAVVRGAEESIKSLKRLQMDYSNKRGKGERK